jgi:phosphoglycolate phosphatase
MTNKRLLLFDIDGTLVNTGGAGVEALKEQIRDEFGVDDDLSDIEIAGKTDSGIIRDILRKHGVEANDAQVTAFAAAYLRELPGELSRCKGHVLPGIEPLLGRLRERPHIVLGLLTGNLARGARLKLEHYRLWHFFEFGAFADDHHERNELGAFARKRASEKHGHEFDAAQIDVIGDTGHDIACGKAIGARTIAVGTGSWSAPRLRSCRPDFYFPDFSDVDAVIHTLGW